MNFKIENRLSRGIDWLVVQYRHFHETSPSCRWVRRVPNSVCWITFEYSLFSLYHMHVIFSVILRIFENRTENNYPGNTFIVLWYILLPSEILLDSMVLTSSDRARVNSPWLCNFCVLIKWKKVRIMSSDQSRESYKDNKIENGPNADPWKHQRCCFDRNRWLTFGMMRKWSLRQFSLNLCSFCRKCIYILLSYSVLNQYFLLSAPIFVRIKFALYIATNLLIEINCTSKLCVIDKAV